MPEGALETFVKAVGAAVRSGRGGAALVAEVESNMRALVRERTWLEARYRRPIPGRPYAQYLLHLPEDGAFSVASFVWSPGEGSPVHDHGTWGVIGQYEGEEEETRYDRATLREAGRVVFRPGDVSHVLPPDREVHRIRNLGSAPAVSVHVYGGDIGRQPRHTFDPATGAARPFVSGYDAPQA
ncbi:MAG TPA: cysteine dioxygenase [Thermodesulfobacteriota bacterium]